MKQSEALALLGKISLYTGRTAGEGDAAAWAEALDADITLTDALDAVAAHYRETDRWIMPSHINHRVRDVYRDRIRRAGTPPIPGGLEYRQEQAWRRLWLDAVRADELDPVETANRAMGIEVIEIALRPVDRRVEQLAKGWSA